MTTVNTEFFDLYSDIIQLICAFLTPFEYVQLSFVCKKGFELFSARGKLNLWEKVQDRRKELVFQQTSFAYYLDAQLVGTHTIGYCHLDETTFDTLVINHRTITIYHTHESRGREDVYRINVMLDETAIEHHMIEYVNCDSIQVYHNNKYNIAYISYLYKDTKELEYCIDLSANRLLYIWTYYGMDRFQKNLRLILHL